MILLYNMGQLMGQQALSVRSVRSILVCAEDDVPAYGICERIYRHCGLGRHWIRMHAHIAEVDAKPWPHEGRRGRIKGLSRGTQNIMYDRRRCDRGYSACGTSLENTSAFLLTTIAFVSGPKARTFALE